ncbi:MAG: elongation factor P, partial [Parcubacteria group bacterium]|nr:elongation factor P [Parcubacteria group bacterium]
YSDLKRGAVFILDGEPYEVEESQFVRMQQRKPVMQTKIKNLITGKVVSRNFHQNEVFHEAEIVEKEMTFLFTHRGQYTFTEPGNPKNRVVLDEAAVGNVARFLKGNLLVTFLSFEEKIIGIRMPIKIEYAVKEAQPADKGNTVQGGTKEATLENGLTVQVPLFINTGDVVSVNTTTGDYSERVEKK